MELAVALGMCMSGLSLLYREVAIVRGAPVGIARSSLVLAFHARLIA